MSGPFFGGQVFAGGFFGGGGGPTVDVTLWGRRERERRDRVRQQNEAAVMMFIKKLAPEIYDQLED